MKVKLIKDHQEYMLINDERFVIATTDPSILEATDKMKLSKQNCDEIFGVVDVEKLAEEFVNDLQVASESVNRAVKLGYEEGFNKAMELNKDKVFSEEQMFRMFLFGHSLSEAIKRGVIEDKPVGEIFNDRIKFIQKPTEIEVEIIMKNSRTGNIVKHDSDLEWDEDGLCDRAIPKLDSEGCLILKKI